MIAKERIIGKRVEVLDLIFHAGEQAGIQVGGVYRVRAMDEHSPRGCHRNVWLQGDFGPWWVFATLGPVEGEVY